MKTKPDLKDIVLLDSNILIYAEQDIALQYEAARSLRDQALTGEIFACVSPQILSEFFAVVTNPRRVDDPLSQQEATDQVRKYYESEELAVIYPGSRIVERMLSLLERYTIAGPYIHDLRLVATMLENGVSKIYTFNVRDFAPFSEIEVLTPPEPTLTL